MKIVSKYKRLDDIDMVDINLPEGNDIQKKEDFMK